MGFLFTTQEIDEQLMRLRLYRTLNFVLERNLPILVMKTQYLIVLMTKNVRWRGTKRMRRYKLWLKSWLNNELMN